MSKPNKPAAPATVATIASQLAAAAPVVTAPAASVDAIGKNTTSSVLGAKKHVRALLSAPGAALTLQELCQKSGKTEVNVRTMLSDLRSAKYAGKDGVFLTISTRGADGKTRYSAAPVAPAAPATPASK